MSDKPNGRPTPERLAELKKAGLATNPIPPDHTFRAPTEEELGWMNPKTPRVFERRILVACPTGIAVDTSIYWEDGEMLSNVARAVIAIVSPTPTLPGGQVSIYMTQFDDNIGKWVYGTADVLIQVPCASVDIGAVCAKMKMAPANVAAIESILAEDAAQREWFGKDDEGRTKTEGQISDAPDQRVGIDVENVPSEDAMRQAAEYMDKTFTWVDSAGNPLSPAILKILREAGVTQVPVDQGEPPQHLAVAVDIDYTAEPPAEYHSEPPVIDLGAEPPRVGPIRGDTVIIDSSKRPAEALSSEPPIVPDSDDNEDFERLVGIEPGTYVGPERRDPSRPCFDHPGRRPGETRGRALYTNDVLPDHDEEAIDVNRRLRTEGK